MRASGAGLRSRKSMLETLVRHLDMVRFTAAASVLAMIGCTGLIDAPPPSKAELARQIWVEKALPALRAAETNCVACHGGEAPRAQVEFLAGADDFTVRETLMGFDPSVVSLDAPQSSRLLNKGQHEGPPLVGQFKSDVQEWIQAEKEAATVGPGPGELGLRTADFTFSLCTGGLPNNPQGTCPVNEIVLDELGEGAGIPGAKLSFVVQGVGTGLYINNLRLVPGPMGAYIEHPLFVSIPTDPEAKFIADTFDRFFNVKMNLNVGAPADQQLIQGGTAAFVNFPPQNKLAIFFKAAKIFQPDMMGPGGGGGCKAATQFEATARQQFANNCSGAACHSTGGTSAASAVDMVGIGQANAMNACNQIRQRLTLTDIPNSAIFLATAPGNNNHPFTFQNNQANHTAFRNAINSWIIAERDAP